MIPRCPFPRWIDPAPSLCAPELTRVLWGAVEPLRCDYPSTWEPKDETPEAYEARWDAIDAWLRDRPRCVAGTKEIAR